MDGSAAHEVGLQAGLRIGICALREGFSLRSVLVLVVLHLLVVAHSSDLVGPIDPGELSVHSIISANDVLIRNLVGTDDCFISSEQSTAALNDELGVKGNVVLLSGSRSRKLFPPD